jgi:hypothetical protein
MKSGHIPLLSYLFIGITSLVLTYATIADKNNEIIENPVMQTTPTPPTDTSSVAEASVATIDSVKTYAQDTLDKIKELTSGSPDNQPSTTESVDIPVAKPVNDGTTPTAPAYGGRKKQKKTRRKGGKSKTKNNSNTKNKTKSNK